MHQNSTKFSCSLCKEDYNHFACPKFKNKSIIDDRHDYIRPNSCCYNCLSKHLCRSCQSKKLCIYCSKSHYSLLHKDQDNSVSNLKESRVSDSNSDLSVPVSSANLEGGSAISSHLNASRKMFPVLLATVRAVIEAPNGRRVHVRAMLDQGSQATFVSESTVQLLRIPRKKIDVTVSGIGASVCDQIYHSVPIMIKSSKSCVTTLSTQAFVLPKITAYVPTEFSLVDIASDLRELDLAHPSLESDERIDLLIGADLYGQTLLDGRRHAKSGNLVAQNTIFGWIISGPSQKFPAHVFHIHVHQSASISVEQTLREFWELEEVPTKNFLTKQVLECEAHFAETHKRDSNGRYVVRLPFIEPPSQLGISLNIALSSLSRLKNKLMQNDVLAVKYRDFLREYRLFSCRTEASK